MAISSARQFDPNIAFFVPADAAFPGVAANLATLRSLLIELDRTEVIFTAARLNLIVSDQTSNDSPDMHWSLRHQNAQSAAALSFFTEEQVNRIDAFIKGNRAGPGNWQLFFRRQLLELIRWACVFCSERPDLPGMAADSQLRERFAQAALIASELWDRRVYKGRFSGPEDLENKRFALLGPFRQAQAETGLGADLPRAFVRGKSLISEHLAAECSDFAELFRSKTGISLDQYYTCLLMVLVQSLGFTSPPGTPRVQVVRDFNVQRFCDDLPDVREAFCRFISCESQTASDMQVALQNTDRFQDENQPYDLNVIRRRPIFVGSTGRAIVIDPVFLAEKACVGPLFHVRQNRVFDAFGLAVERYGQGILRAMYPSIGSGLLYERLRCPLSRLRKNPAKDDCGEG